MEEVFRMQNLPHGRYLYFIIAIFSCPEVIKYAIDSITFLKYSLKPSLSFVSVHFLSESLSLCIFVT